MLCLHVFHFLKSNICVCMHDSGTHSTIYPQYTVNVSRSRIEEYTCDAKLFKCHNGECIHPVLRCNGQRDCKDWSDEVDCGKFTIYAYTSLFIPSHPSFDQFIRYSVLYI